YLPLCSARGFWGILPPLSRRANQHLSQLYVQDCRETGEWFSGCWRTQLTGPVSELEGSGYLPRPADADGEPQEPFSEAEVGDHQRRCEISSAASQDRPHAATAGQALPRVQHRSQGQNGVAEYRDDQEFCGGR